MIDGFTLLPISEAEKSEILSKILSGVSSEKIFDEEINFFEGIELFQNNRSRTSGSPKIAVVLNPWLGRFGNNFIQTSNALKFAKVTGIDYLCLPEHEFIGSFSLPMVSAGLCDENIDSYDYLLSSQFWPWPSKSYYPLFDYQFDSSVIGALRESINFVRADTISPNDLTCFIRSGDIFIESPNSQYGQPPLSFYRKVITEGAWEKIYIAAEDDKNPVSGALLGFCKEKRFNHQLIRRGMRGDFEFLLGSTNICGGFTSLLPAIAKISTDLIRSFSFETRIWEEGIEIQINDANGHYKDSVLNNNWANTSEQRELMLTYSIENLG